MLHFLPIAEWSKLIDLWLVEPNDSIPMVICVLGMIHEESHNVTHIHKDILLWTQETQNRKTIVKCATYLLILLLILSAKTEHLKPKYSPLSVDAAAFISHCLKSSYSLKLCHIEKNASLLIASFILCGYARLGRLMHLQGLSICFFSSSL